MRSALIFLLLSILQLCELPSLALRPSGSHFLSKCFIGSGWVAEQLCYASSVGFRGAEAAFDVTFQHHPHVVGHPSWQLGAHLLLPSVEVVARVVDLLAERLAPHCRVRGTADLRRTHKVIGLPFMPCISEPRPLVRGAGYR